MLWFSVPTFDDKFIYRRVIYKKSCTTIVTNKKQPINVSEI